MASLARPRIRQMDVVEWFRSNASGIKALRAERWKLEKGVICYLKDAAEFVRDMRSKKPKDAEKAKDGSAAAKPELSTLDQYFISQDLLKRMKWKRVTWDNDADFDSFSRRMIDSDSLFSKVPALSFMAIHIVRDQSSRAAAVASPQDRQITSIKPGTMTKWFMEETKFTAENPRPVFVAPPKARQAPFTVDWEAGSVKILDTASAQEMLVYLTAAGPRVQALQQRLDDEQTKMTEELDNLRVRLGVTAIKYNKYERTFWDDPDRKTDPANYVTPTDLRLFIDSITRRSFLIRRFVKGNQLRIIPAGKPYALDLVAKEICIPANFSEYNFLALHRRYESLERVFNALRMTATLWFFLAMMLVGDLEII